MFLDGQAMAEGLFGDAMATNNFMVGVAYQAGTIPLQAESIESVSTYVPLTIATPRTIAIAFSSDSLVMIRLGRRSSASTRS